MLLYNLNYSAGNFILAALGSGHNVLALELVRRSFQYIVSKLRTLADK